jgi:hypothetical protein
MNRSLCVAAAVCCGLLFCVAHSAGAQDSPFASGLPLITDGESFAITGENPTGEKGRGGQAASKLGPTRKGRPAVPVPAGQRVTLADIRGAGCIRHIWITVPPPSKDYAPGPNTWRDIVIRMWWDGAKTPCVEAPLGDFFGIGQGASVPLVSQMTTVTEGRGLNCYWPMPFAKSARIEVENQGPNDVREFFFQIDGERLRKLDKRMGRFHAQWRRENPTTLRKDYTILEAKGRGQYVGTMLSLVPLSGDWWGEGEVKFYIDGDREFPTIAGTGTEDYFGSAWGLGENSAPYHGTPLERGGRASMYRWHVPDPVRFKRDLRVAIQNIGYGKDGLFERSDDMCSTAYWYQQEPHAPFPPLPAVEQRRPREPMKK